MEETSQRLLYYLLPGVQSPVTSSDVSGALDRDTLLTLGCGIGLRQWRQITVALNQANKDPLGARIVGNEIHNVIRGHTNSISDQHYGATSEKPENFSWDLLFACERLSSWWQHITGLWLQILLPTYSSLINYKIIPGIWKDDSLDPESTSATLLQLLQEQSQKIEVLTNSVHQLQKSRLVCKVFQCLACPMNRENRDLIQGGDQVRKRKDQPER